MPIAASVTGRQLPPGSAGDPRVGVGTIAVLLTAKDPRLRANVLIEAPGGRGKSALWNELIARAVDVFEQDPFCPLPVLVDPRRSSVVEMVVSGFGRFGISPESTSAQLKAGELVAFLDNSSGSGITAAEIESFFRSPEGECTRLCLASRPDRAWHVAVKRSDVWLAIEPERLTDESVGEFIDAYAAADAQRARHDEPCYAAQVADQVRSFLPVCRSEDGTYLPLLVRLCTLAVEREIRSVDDIYQSTLKRLLSREPGTGDLEIEQLLMAAEQLAAETYWKKSERVFRFERTVPESTQTVRELLSCGVVVSADRNLRLADEPRQVRFFHDSMQSYLVARSLHRADEYRCLLRAAGDPAFSSAASDLIGSTGSEVFQMCLYVFDPARVRRLLTGDLQSWAERYRALLSIEDVMGGLTEGTRATVEGRLSASSGAAECLLLAVKTILAEDLDEDNLRLGRLYARLAPKIWSRVEVENPAAQGVPTREGDPPEGQAAAFTSSVNNSAIL